MKRIKINFRWLIWFEEILIGALNGYLIPSVFSQIISRSPDELGPVYSIDPSDEREPSEAFGEDLDKELKQGPVKPDIAEPLSQYELNSYQSEFISFYTNACFKFCCKGKKTELGWVRFVVEGDTVGTVPNSEGYQDALSKKQRRPQEDERRRKEQGATVSSLKRNTSVVCKGKVAKPFSL